MKRISTILIFLAALGAAGFLGYQWLTNASLATATELQTALVRKIGDVSALAAMLPAAKPSGVVGVGQICL